MDIGLLNNSIDIVCKPEELSEDKLTELISNKAKIEARVNKDGYIGFTVRGSHKALYNIMCELTNIVASTGIEIY